MANHSTAIANVFIKKAKAEGKLLTQMQLQKLVYIAHGWGLAINGEPLTSDAPCAWDYGPVYPELWQSLRGYGRSAVNKMIKYGDYDCNIFSDNADDIAVAELSQPESDLVDKIYELYGHFHAFQLSALTHQEGTPWYRVFVENNSKKGVITNNDIKDHFVELAQQRAA
ncbi:MAG: DUF4065 domain-containing protein [Rhodobacteraceae bacterium]|nr:DUF4065 domain-containing protein [Paracoccaceae bacterium]